MRLFEIMKFKPNEDGSKDYWRPGEIAYFEYHCYQGHDSEDAEAWYRSHQPVTVLGMRHRGYGKTLRQRIDGGDPRVYRVRWGDGFEHDVFEDELCVSADFFSSEGDPPDTNEIEDARNGRL